MDLRDLQKQELRRFEAVDFRVGEDRTIEFPFSSEMPVSRWFGQEVLSHQADAVNLARMNDGAPVLFNHDFDRVIGVVERAWIDGEKQRGMARVRFSRNEFASQIVADIQDGILRNVSVGYLIRDAKPGADDAIIATSWEPYEVSIVSVPTDQTVGIGRALDTDTPAQASAAATPTPSPQPMEDTNTPDLSAVRAEAAAEERTRVASITAMTREHACEPLTQDLIERGVSVADAQSQVLAELSRRAKQPATPKASGSAQPQPQAQPIAGGADIGLSDKEARSFSFVKAIRAMAYPQDRAMQEAAAFEREVSEATAERMGMARDGFHVPHDVLRRDLTVATASAAGDLVFTDARPGSFIELLRNRLALSSLGVTTLTGLQGPVAIPKQQIGRAHV